MVNTALRRAGSHHAWAKAFVYSGTLGSALHNERCLHFRHTPCAIPHDFIPARLAILYPRSLVADRRARPDGDAHGAARLLDPALDCRPDAKPVSARRRSL